KEPDERFPSCTAFVRALSGGSQNGSGSGSNPGAEPVSWAKAGKTVHDVELTPPGSGRGGVAVLPTPARAKKARAASQPEAEDSHLMAATAAQAEVGVVRPTVLIGVGSFGRRALQEVRCRLVDRVGDVTQVPSFRFLYVHVDPDAVGKAVNAPPDVALSSDEVFPVPLQPVTGYRR